MLFNFICVIAVIFFLVSMAVLLLVVLFLDSVGGSFKRDLNKFNS